MNDNDERDVNGRESAAPGSIIAAQESEDQPAATFKALDAALARTPGTILFTILIHHPALKQSERYFSNMPDAYPVGGRKPITDSPWMKQVMFDGKPWICRNKYDVREVFFDYELIWSLGCESMLNMPVRWRGQTLGTLNLSHKSGHYEEGHLAHVHHLAALAVPALMTISRV